MVGPPRPDRPARRRAGTVWLLLAPMLLALLLVAAWPLLRTLWFSFTDATLFDLSAARYVGLANFALLLADPEWWRSVRNTLVFTAVSVALEIGLGFAIALVLNREFPGRGPLRAAVLIPWAIPTVVSAKMWGWMFHDVYGVVNAILLQLGVIGAPVAWTASPDLAMAALIAVDVWKTTPFAVLLLLAGLQMLPQDYYDAAEVDGASALSKFVRITLPLMKPSLAVAAIFRALDAMRMFDLVYVLTGSNRETMTMAVYARQQLFDFQDFGVGSAASTLLFLVIALVTAIYLTMVRLRLSEHGALAG
ncbi:MAG TPA: sugar ABC transporter permease [Candidatus Acidoferrum sp.]|nr:sugar ABC transporter permease [Candidatus Acidoferrum sp.]